MILEAVLGFFFNIIGALFNLLPDWTPIDLGGMTSDLSSGPGGAVLSGLGWLNYYVPVDTMMTLLGVLFVIWGGTYFVRFIIWLLQLFHVAGGAS